MTATTTGINAIDDPITIDRGTLAMLVIAAGHYSTLLAYLGNDAPESQPLTAAEIHDAVDRALSLIRTATAVPA